MRTARQSADERAASAEPFGARTTRFLRFLAAGAVNTVFGYLVFLVLIYTIAIDWLALSLTYVIGLTFNFFVFSRFVFTARSASIPRYVSTYVVAFLINFVLYSALFRWIPNPAIVQLICLPPVVIATYLLMQRWSFSAADPAHEKDSR